MTRTPSPAVLAAITACVVAAGAGAGLLLQPGKERAVKPTGPGVNIAVVAPREPVPEPGSVMDVGELADGYSHSGYVQPPAVTVGPYPNSDDGNPPAYVEPGRVERPRVAAPVPAPAPIIVERREPPRRWPFGFDQPAPDYEAERRDRRARRDEEWRLEAERERFADRGDDPEWRDDPQPDAYPAGRDRRGRERQWYRSDGSRAPAPGRYD